MTQSKTEIKTEIDKIKHEIFCLECADKLRPSDQSELHRLRLLLKELEEIKAKESDHSERIKPIKSSMFTQEKIELLKRTQFNSKDDDDFRKFVNDCETSGLDPFARQIYSIERWDSIKGKAVRTTQVSIDGFRLIAQRSGQYAGQTPVQWCGKDGIWKDIWTSDEKPYAARVGVMRRGFKEPLYAIAKWSAYVPNKSSHIWLKMPDHMLAKVAEALALRKAFPQELSGFYTSEEMHSVNEPEETEKYEEKPELKKELSKKLLSFGIERNPEDYKWFSERLIGSPLKDLTKNIENLIPKFKETINVESK